MLKITFHEYNQEDEMLIINILKYQWASLEHNERLELFRWRYINNPQSKKPFVFVAKHNEDIVGIRAYVIQTCVFEQKDFFIATPADAIVHPGYRKMGIFSKLNTFSFRYLREANISLILNFTSNSLSGSAYEKLGWQSIGIPKQYWLRLNNYIFPKNMNSIRGNDFATTLGNRQKICFSKELWVNEITKFNEDNPINYFKIRHDYTYYSWRSRKPSENRMCAYLLTNNKLSGYIFARKLNKYILQILEYNCQGKEILRILTEKLSHHFFTRLSIINVSLLSNDTLKQLKGANFRPEPGILLRIFNKTRPPIQIRPTSEFVTDNSFQFFDHDLRNRELYNIFQIDFH